jgi:hypothetical protein
MIIIDAALVVGEWVMQNRDFESKNPIIVRIALVCSAISFEVITVKDVLFQIDVARSVMSTAKQIPTFELQRVQIHRMIERYSDIGWVRLIKTSKRGGKKLTFSMTPQGIIGLLESLIDMDAILGVPEVIFVQWFMHTYHEVLLNRLNSSAATAKDLELFKALMQRYRLIEKQMALISQAIAEVKVKIRESQAMQAKISQELAKGFDMIEAVNRLEHSYSYSQANQWRYAELIATLPEDMRTVEIQRALPSREQDLYGVNLLHLEQTYEFYRCMISA